MEDGPEVIKRRPKYSVHLSELHLCEIVIDEEKKLFTDTNIPAQMVAPAIPFTVNEV